MTTTNEIVVFGGGCFWCTEAIFKRLKGVLKVTSGYAGCKMDKPSYYDVSEGNTGYAEVVKIDFDNNLITYNDLLEVFFAVHDPTSMNRQGNDEGTQYRSVIFYTNDKQNDIAEKSIEKMKKAGVNVVTQVQSLDKFYEAESYHQDYYSKNSYEPYCQLIISPKLQHLREKFGEKLKEQEL